MIFLTNNSETLFFHESPTIRGKFCTLFSRFSLQRVEDENGITFLVPWEIRLNAHDGKQKERRWVNNVKAQIPGTPF